MFCWTVNLKPRANTEGRSATPASSTCRDEPGAKPGSTFADCTAGTFELSVGWKPISTQQEMTMDWNRVEGNWKQFKGAAKEKWGKLTDDDLNVIEGRREQLEGKLQQRYGFAKDQIHKDVDDWFRTLK